jgi:hypothetical protein
MWITRCAIIITTLTLLILPSTILADWSHDISANTVIAGPGAWQGEQQMVSDGAGGIILTWVDHRDLTSDIYAQRLDAQGNAMWTAGGIPVFINMEIANGLRMASDGEGGAIITWYDIHDGGYKVFAQRLSSAGAIMWDPDGVRVCTYASTQIRPAIAPISDGVIIMWVDIVGPSENIYTQRINSAGSLVWSSSGMMAATGNGYINSTQILPKDDGAFLVWDNDRPDEGEIYTQQINGSGAIMWGSMGILLESSAYFPREPAMDHDGLGGIVVTWSSLHITAQRVSDSGSLLWGAGGVLLPTHNDLTANPVILGDGSGGAFIAFEDFHYETTAWDVFAQRLSPAGDLLWGSSNTSPIIYDNYLSNPKIASDGADGVYISCENAWTAPRCQRLDGDGNRWWDPLGVAYSGDPADAGSLEMIVLDNVGVVGVWGYFNTTSELRAQLIDFNGYPGLNRPSIIAVEDRPNDQGGEVIVEWNRSWLDGLPAREITNYSLWMQAPDSKTASPDIAKLSADLNIPESHVETLLRNSWIFVSEIPATQWEEYSAFAPTLNDSTEAEIPLFDFKVLAHAEAAWVYWESATASGYSVDNLAPGAPLALNGEQDGLGGIDLNWTASSYQDEDLNHYRVYRAESPGVPVDETHFIGQAVIESYLDPAGFGSWYYRVTAVDAHGNESDPSNEAAFGGLSGIQNLPTHIGLNGVWPNPFNPRGTISYSLTQEVSITLDIHDVSGRLVTTLVNGLQPAGHHEVIWDGRNSMRNSVASGVYMVRLVVDKQQFTQRMMLIK